MSSNPIPIEAGRRERKRNQTLDHLAATAFSLFEQHGYDAVTMEQIAAQADVSKGTVAGTLANVVYFGTDTHYHVKLDGGDNFIVRHQNSRSGAVTFEPGAKVGIVFEDDDARILRD